MRAEEQLPFLSEKPLETPLYQQLGTKRVQCASTHNVTRMASQGKRVRRETSPLFQDDCVFSQGDGMDSLLEMIDQPKQNGNKHPVLKNLSNFSNLGGIINGVQAPFNRRDKPELKRTLTTFGDVASAKTQEYISLDSLDERSTQEASKVRGLLRFKTFNLPPPPLLPPPPTAPLPSAAAAAAELAPLPPAPAPPVDWSLKSCVRLLAPEPLASFEDAGLASAVAQCEALRRFAGGLPAGSASQDRHQQSLLSWQYPESPMEPPVRAALRGSPAGESLLAARDDTWVVSFQSLTQQLRAGSCDMFYYVSPQNTRRCAFVALFRGAGMGGYHVPHVLVSRSTSGLRQLLREEGVRFSMPLLPRDSRPAETAATLADFQGADVGRAVVRSTEAQSDNTPQSLLLLEGGLALAGLSELLFNGGGRLYETSCDVPMLLSPIPFAHAHVHHLQPRVVTSRLSGLAGSAREAVYRVELFGLIPPWQLDRICSVAAAAQESGFQLSMETLPASSCLNFAPATAAASSVAVADGACDSEPYGWGRGGGTPQRWLEPSRGLSSKVVVSALLCSEQLFTAQLKYAKSEVDRPGKPPSRR